MTAIFVTVIFAVRRNILLRYRKNKLTQIPLTVSPSVEQHESKGVSVITRLRQALNKQLASIIYPTAESYNAPASLIINQSSPDDD